MPAAAIQIVRIALNVADLEGACAFYCQALGFERLPTSPGGADRALLRLGEQTLELRGTGGRAYPQPRAANDPWFQHFAIAVSDMALAYRQLSTYGHEPISQGGPQLLPVSTGSVTAYKFRDPDGHPLELSYIPGSQWLTGARGAHGSPFLGIDHSAIGVRALDAGLRFYTEVLGLTEMALGLNQGPEQDRLDGLAGACVDIASVRTLLAGPHIELLHYRTPVAGTPPLWTEPQDIAATRLILSVRDLDELHARLDEVGVRWWPGVYEPERSTVVRDRDGHRLVFIAVSHPGA